MPEMPPRVFISYSHDSPEYLDRVLELADQLRTDGIDASIDQYEQFPPEGWPAWCEREIRKADFVLLVCTETYLRRVNGEEQPGKGDGVLWEANLIRQHLYDAGSVSNKFIAVLLNGAQVHDIPLPVKGRSYYRLDMSEGYDALFAVLSKQPLVRKPELGPLRKLPPRPRQSGTSRKSQSTRAGRAISARSTISTNSSLNTEPREKDTSANPHVTSETNRIGWLRKQETLWAAMATVCGILSTTLLIEMISSNNGTLLIWSSLIFVGAIVAFKKGAKMRSQIEDLLTPRN